MMVGRMWRRQAFESASRDSRLRVLPQSDISSHIICKCDIRMSFYCVFAYFPRGSLRLLRPIA